MVLKVDRVFKIRSECNCAMRDAADEKEFMDDVCRIIIESGGYRLAWVGLAGQDDEKSVHPVAQSGFEEGYLKTLNIVWSDTERGRGPTGTAIRTGKPCIARNIQTDPNFAPWRDAAAQRGYVSSIALPLMDGKRVFGALNIYASEPDAFGPEEVDLLLDLAGDLSYGITTLRLRAEHAGAEEELRKYRKHLERLVEDRTVKLRKEIIERKRVEEALKSSLKIFQILGSSSVDEIIQFGLEESVRLTESKIGYLYSVNPDQKTLGLHSWSIETLRRCPAAGKETHHPIDNAGVWADCVRQKKAVIHNDYVGLQYKKGLPPGHVPIVREMAVPMFENGGIAAVICVGNKPWDYDQFDVDQISLLVENTWNIIQRKRSEIELQNNQLRLEELVKERTDDLRMVVKKLQQKIAEWKLAEKALQESEDRYRRITNAVTDYIYTVRADAGKPVETKHSEACLAVTGYGVEDFTADPYLWINMVHEADRDLVRDQINQVLSGHSPPPVEHRIVRKNGVMRWVESTVVTNRDGSGNLISYEGIVRDVTERRNLEGQLLHAQKMEAVGRLAGGVAHDFNNILSAIINYTYILGGNLKADDPSRESIDKILALSEKATDITRGLLAFSRKQYFEFVPVRINDIMKIIGKLLVSFIGEDIAVRMKLTSKEPVILADRTQVEQVIMNLATNARDAMPGGGSFIIETDVIEIDDNFRISHGFGEPGSYALLSVSDTGAGMDEETRRKIFEPFFTTKEVSKGTGLGLSIIYGIIKQHKGYINVFSGPGKGTTFRIYLPEIKAAVEKGKMKNLPDLKGKGETILLAEDEASVRDSIRKIIEKSGYKVIEAVDGEDAVDKFLEHKDEIRILVLDVVMPRKNGLEAYEEIKKLSPGIRAIILSGYSAEMMNNKNLPEEGFSFTVKPVQPEKLLITIKEALKNEDSGPR